MKKLTRFLLTLNLTAGLCLTAQAADTPPAEADRCLPGPKPVARSRNQALRHYEICQNSPRPEAEKAGGLVAPGAKLETLADSFRFTEGPAADAEGNVFFTDIPKNRIHRYSRAGELTVFREDSGGANGLYFSSSGDLYVCEGNNGRLVSIDSSGKVTVLAAEYGGKRFNKPNDLWIDPQGGVYFTDPCYGRIERTQDGEHVYYLSPDRSTVIRVIDDMVRPNGVIGTADGSILYVADHGGGKIFSYTVREDGTLAGKTLFADTGSDGLTLDSRGNLYVTTDAVLVYNPRGKLITRIETPKRPANVTFGGESGRTLFITARSHLYSIEMNVRGMKR